MIKKTLIVKLEEGLHARPASVLVKTASAFQSDIRVGKGEKLTNAKSILGVLSLAIARGQEVNLVVEGPDEEAAVSALEKIITEREV